MKQSQLPGVCMQMTNVNFCEFFPPNCFQSEAVKFLLCVTGWSEDSVQVPASLLSRLLQQSEDTVGAAKGDNSVLFLTVLLQAAGQQLSNVDRFVTVCHQYFTVFPLTSIIKVFLFGTPEHQV